MSPIILDFKDAGEGRFVSLVQIRRFVDFPMENISRSGLMLGHVYLQAMTSPLMAPNLACSSASPSTSRSGLSLVNWPHHKYDRVKAVENNSYQALSSHLFLSD
jgi:hypothetical protein